MPRPPSRSNWRSISLVVAALLYAGCAAKSAVRPDGPVIVHLQIEGPKQISESELKEHILTSERTLNPFDEPARFDANAWQADLRRIERFYQAQGFYQAKILEEGMSPVPNKQDRVNLHIRLEEGLPTHVDLIELIGIDTLPAEQQDKLTLKLPIRKGDVFKEAQWDALKKEMGFRLRELGYAQAKVEAEAVVDARTRLARLTLFLDPGVRYRFGPVYVATDENAQIPRKRIVEQAEGTIKQGEWYEESTLQEAQTRILQMGVFSAVKVTHGTPDPDTGTLPIIIDVREAPFRSLGAGVGFGVDSSRNDVRFTSEFTHRNFFGDLRRLTLRGKAGWAFLPNVVAALFDQNANGRKTGPIAKLRLEFEQPHFVFPYVRFMSSIEFEHDLQLAYTANAGRLNLGPVWQPWPWLSISPFLYNLEWYGIPEGSADAVRVLPLNCASCFLSYVEQRVELDKRDNPLEPRHGFYAAFSMQEGGGPLGGSFTYLKFVPDIRGYVTPFDGRFTLAAKIRFGTLVPISEVTSPDVTRIIPYGRPELINTGPGSPIVTRFYSGGADMRGFNSRRLSPLLVVPQTNCLDANGAVTVECQGNNIRTETLPIGGNGLFEGSLEARYKVSSNLILALFFDTGFVSPGPFSFNAFDQLQYAIGIGMRYLTIVGPIRVDLAFRLGGGRQLPLYELGIPVINPVTGRTIYVQKYAPLPVDGTRGCFVGGFSNSGRAGYPEGPCSLHIFIGEAF